MLQMFVMLAEAGISPSDLAPAASVVGSLGISIWYVYYSQTVSIPKIHDDHKAERKEMQERFDAALLEQRKDFGRMLTEQRNDFNADAQMLIGELKEARLQFFNSKA